MFLTEDANPNGIYLMLDEALSENLIEIVEKDDGDSVPELRVMNKSSKMILILDTEELVGPNRIGL